MPMGADPILDWSGVGWPLAIVALTLLAIGLAISLAAAWATWAKEHRE